jgi:hypothetical protein
MPKDPGETNIRQPKSQLQTLDTGGKPWSSSVWVRPEGQAPTASVVEERQASNFESAVRKTITDWSDKMQVQVPNGRIIGAVYLGFNLSKVQLEAINRFRQQGWTVTVTPQKGFLQPEHSWYSEVLFSKGPAGTSTLGSRS